MGYEKCGDLNYDHPIWIKGLTKPKWFDCMRFKGHTGKHMARGFCPDWRNVKIIGRKDGVCSEHGCKNKAYRVNYLSPVTGVIECRRHYKEHQ